MGFLYVDGHVRAYHGERPIASRAYVARRHLAMPASTDYWINDRSGEPLLVVTGEVNAALTRALPRLLREVRDVVGERRVTIVFDRGGWSPKLFGTIIKDGFDVLTYRAGRCRRINERRFIRRRAELDGRWVDYLLHDQPVRFLKGKLRLRQVTRLCDNGHQTQVITSRWDLCDIEVAYRMFDRWRQENFFKYMREEFLLDALVDYQIEPEDPTRTVPNPERRALDKEIRAARADLAKLEREYGAAAADNAEERRPTMRGFTPPRRSVRCSTKRRPSSPAPACACALPCVRRRASGSPSQARQASTPSPLQPLPRAPDRPPGAAGAHRSRCLKAMITPTFMISDHRICTESIRPCKRSSLQTVVGLRTIAVWTADAECSGVGAAACWLRGDR